MCYRTIKGILGSCESLCLLFSMLFNFGKNSKVKFLIFFSWVVSFVVGRFEIVLGRLKIVVDRCGSLWIVVGRCGSLWVVPGFSNYGFFSRQR